MKMRILTILTSAAAMLATMAAHAQYTAADANTLMDAYKANYYYDDGGGAGHFTGAYASGTQLGPGFWAEAEEIEAAEDAAARNATYKPLVTSLLKGFLYNHTSNWTGATSYNDDMMWATIAFLRGYHLTGTQNFLTVAKSNFDLTWTRGYDTVNGGMWWNTSDTNKLSCVENPASIAAYLLYQYTGDVTYQQKSLSLLQYEIANFYNATTGAVWDGMTGNVVTSYNQGTFIRAAGLNGYFTQAELTLNHMMTSMGATTPTSNGYNILPDYGQGNNNSGFNSIAIRWATLFVENQGLQTTYLPWLQANAQAAWDVRDTTQNLSWQDWRDTMPTGQVVGSWDCVSSLAALQVVPAP